MTGNGKHLCWGEQPGSMLGGGGVYHSKKRKARQEGVIKPVGKDTTSSPVAAEKRSSEEISYSNVLVIVP